MIYKNELRKEISLRFLTESFTFRLIQVSSTYFTKPDVSNNKKPNANDNEETKIEKTALEPPKEEEGTNSQMQA